MTNRESMRFSRAATVRESASPAGRNVTDAGIDIRDGELLAAVDLGSNSFHLVVARYEHGGLRLIDRLRDSVRLAMGLRPDRSLDPERRERALECLARFGQRLRALPPERVRAVATNTVRQLANPQTFLLPAETALGHPIEVVSGREEARLIYLGVAHGMPQSRQRRLVIDIGGGSTEFIIGQGFDALETESVQMGCIASDAALLRRRQDLGEALAPGADRDRGRAAAVRGRLPRSAAGAKRSARPAPRARSATSCRRTAGANRASARARSTRLRDALIEAGSIDNLRLAGLAEERAAVIAGGVAILEAAFATFALEQMSVCETAMREGLLYDMVGRALHARSALGEHRRARDRATASTARRPRACITPRWCCSTRSPTPGSSARSIAICSAGARDIHEIGLAIAHSLHHLHGAYIVANSDLAGFSRQGQQALAAIIRSHRRKPDRESIDALPERLRRTARRLTALLRLAALLSREPHDRPAAAAARQRRGQDAAPGAARRAGSTSTR